MTPGKIAKLLNIVPDSNQKWILISMAVRSVLLAFIAPTVNQAMYQALPTKWFAFSSMVSCISGLLIGFSWRGGFRDGVLKMFAVFSITESIAGFILGVYMALFNQNLWIYAITALLYQNLVSILVGRCMTAFQSVLWNHRERETYDNNNYMVMCLSMIIGYIVAMAYTPGLRLSLLLFGISCLIDDAGWITVFFKNKEKLKNI